MCVVAVALAGVNGFDAQAKKKVNRRATKGTKTELVKKAAEHGCLEEAAEAVSNNKAGNRHGKECIKKGPKGAVGAVKDDVKDCGKEAVMGNKLQKADCKDLKKMDLKKADCKDMKKDGCKEMKGECMKEMKGECKGHEGKGECHEMKGDCKEMKEECMKKGECHEMKGECKDMKADCKDCKKDHQCAHKSPCCNEGACKKDGSCGKEKCKADSKDCCN